MQQEISFSQEGSKVCGIFAIAYATELVYGSNPSICVFDQSEMRNHLLDCLQKREMTPLPKARTLNTPAKETDATKHINDTQKWSFPSQKTTKSPPSPTEIPISNRFSPLANPATQKRSSTVRHKSSFPLCDTSNTPKSTHSSDKPIPSTSAKSKSPTSNQPHKDDPYIVNMSNRTLSPAERKVLHLGLSFSHQKRT